VDRPDLAKSLLGKRFLFSWAVMKAKWRLLLYGFGLSTADTQDLIGSLDDMRIYLRRVALAHQASRA
jgi:hypothetical protein